MTSHASRLCAQGKLDIPHALVLDECNGALHVADREASRVQQFDIDSGDAERDYDVAAFGMPYALTRGPYGSLLALCWKPASGEVWVVLINTKSGERPCTDLDNSYPIYDLCLRAHAVAYGIGENGFDPWSSFRGADSRVVAGGRRGGAA